MKFFFQFKWIKIKVNCGRQTLRLAMSQTRVFVAAATFWLVPLFSLCFYLDWTARVLTSFAYTWPTRPSKYFDGAIIGRSIFQKKTSKFHFVEVGHGQWQDDHVTPRRDLYACRVMWSVPDGSLVDAPENGCPPWWPTGPCCIVIYFLIIRLTWTLWNQSAGILGRKPVR